MGIRQFKPVTKGTRFRTVSDFSDITTSTPEKSLLEPIKKSGGRDNHGHIAMRRRGGGHKRQYRVIDFKRNKHGVAGDGPPHQKKSKPPPRPPPGPDGGGGEGATNPPHGRSVGGTNNDGPGAGIRQ